MASRVKNGRSRAARLLIDGTDPDEVMQLQKEVFIILSFLFSIIFCYFSFFNHIIYLVGSSSNN